MRDKDDGGLLCLDDDRVRETGRDELRGEQPELAEFDRAIPAVICTCLRVNAGERFGRVLRQRRKSASGPSKLLQQLIGLEAKLNQYEQGEAFIAAVEAEGGPSLLDRVWERPENLPTMAEIRDPSAWLSRVGAPAAAG